jgi:hypothetical protein
MPKVVGIHRLLNASTLASPFEETETDVVVADRFVRVSLFDFAPEWHLWPRIRMGGQPGSEIGFGFNE